jgi:hypothetical protein
VLTEQQWRDLERLRPGQAEEVPATETPAAR